MAEKGFGVKEINLIGPSGTPTITSPNNLNLNANNVAISTNVSIGGTLSVTGNVSVGGTLTYEDVTSIDSVGVVTARSGVVTPNVDVDDFVTVGSNIQLGNAGVVTATTFSGSGASLTSIPAGQLTGIVADARISTLTASKLSGALPAISGANLTNLPATDPTNTDIQVVYNVTANGASAYRFAGNGVVSTADNPDLYFIRGQKYRFVNNSGGSHPFQIRESSGGTAYSTGVTNNGAASGNIDFAPTFDSPAQLVYQCTSHGGMVGNIYLRDAAGNNTNVGVTTFSKATGDAQLTVHAEQNDSGADSELILETSNDFATSAVMFKDSTGEAGSIAYNHGDNYIKLSTNGTNGGTERVRITSDGKVVAGGSGTGYPSRLQSHGAGNLLDLNSTSGAAVIRFYESGTGRFDIRTNNGSSGLNFYDSLNGVERLRITSNGNQYFGRPGSFGSLTGLDESSFAFTFASGTANTHPNTNNRDTDFVEAMQIHGPVRDTTNTPALVLTECGGQATGRQSLVFWNGDYNSGAGYIKSRIYTQVGGGYNSTNFYIDVAAGNRSIQQRLRIDENGNFHGSGSNNISDQRLKKDIATITDPLTKIKGLTGRSFKWNEDSTKFDDKTKFGFIAQEVETILPELVDSNGIMHFDANDNICDEFEATSHSKSVFETGIIPITVEALKALIAKVENLEAKVAALEVINN